jgi:hypothetical protein
MPDTGAPWNIPYVAPSDLVRDYPSDSEDLADAIALALDAAGNPGIGSNVVQVIKTDTFTTSSTSYGTITGLSVTITPSDAASKILLLANVNVTIGGGADTTVALCFGGGNAGTYIAGASGSRIAAATGHATTDTANRVANSVTPHERSMIYLDSPATTSATTYTVQIRSGGGGTVYVNRSAPNADASSTLLAASSITAIEVAA